MRMSIYLSNDVADILRCYGTIDDVVHRILVAGAEGLIDIMEKPTIAEKKGGHYYKVNIKEPMYLELLELYGTKSSRISLRRLLYWFVENEIYEELGWEPQSGFITTNSDRSFDVLMELKQYVHKASKLMPEYYDQFNEIKQTLNKIEEEIWNA